MGVGYFYALTPVYLRDRLQALLGIEQTIRMENFFTPGSLPMGVTVLDENGHALISLTGPENRLKVDSHWMQERSWFGYTSGFRELVLKKSLPPSSLSIVYSVPVDMVLERIRILILNAIILNVLVGIALFTLARVCTSGKSLSRRKLTRRGWKSTSNLTVRLLLPPRWVSVSCAPRMVRTSSVTSWRITT